MRANRTIILARRVVLQILADRRTLVLIMLLPVILLTVVGILINQNTGSLTIGVVNHDAGASMGALSVNLGDRLIETLRGMGEFDVQELDDAGARLKLDEGDLDAAITLPESFTQSVIQTRSLVLPVEFEGSNPMLSERLNTMLERVAVQSINVLALASLSGSVPAAPAAGSIDVSLETTYLHGGPEYDTLDYMAPALLAFFVFFITFLLTSISFLRERLAGTLERLQATPIRPHEIIVGYMSGFLVFGLLQGLVALLFTVWVLRIDYAGNLLTIFIVEALLVMVSVNLGIFLSTFAQNEFQVLQFIPLVVVTQGLLGGIVWQVEDMPDWLQPLSRLMPLTYAANALRAVMIKGESLVQVAPELGVIVLFGLLMIALAARTAGRAKI